MKMGKCGLSGLCYRLVPDVTRKKTPYNHEIHTWLGGMEGILLEIMRSLKGEYKKSLEVPESMLVIEL